MRSSTHPTPITPSPSHPPTPSLPPPPKPYSTPDLLIHHQLQLLTTHRPTNVDDATRLLYDHLDHPIKCIASLKAHFKARLQNSTLLQHITPNYEDLGPPDFDQEVITPAPICPDLTLKPVLKHFARKRFAFPREGTTPLYLRFTLALQDPVPHQPTDRWALADIAIDSS